MTDSAPTLPMKSLLHDFLDWLERVHCNGELGADSDFAVEPSPETIALAGFALDAALIGKQPVLFASDAPVTSVLGTLILRRSGITLEQAVQGNLTDAQFAALTLSVVAVAKSRLRIESPVEQPGANASVEHFEDRPQRSQP